VQDGSVAGSDDNGVVSFGVDASIERELGLLATSSQIGTFEVRIMNTGSTTLTSITVSFTGEQWPRGDVSSRIRARSSTASPTTSARRHSDGGSDRDFVAPDDGHAHRTPMSTTSIGLSCAPERDARPLLDDQHAERQGHRPRGRRAFSAR
jgi:hypothetical protein